jgi:cbb3-type cytochrome oxidase maturation protein
MNGLLILIPIALLLGGAGVIAFFWALKSNQFDDPEGAAARILLDDDVDDQSPDANERR